ncbi:FixH family protein [Ramlibacter sp. MAHUQ-53]|uniref:FixH family protein n=1 Tax=unclassified Ramlibacter TaxID=2617605 RepID=UPI00362A6B67
MDRRPPASDTSPATPSRPWWAHGHVWLLIAGPAAVIVAGVITLVLALRTPDPLVAEDYYRRGLEINKTLAEREGGKAMMPAVQGRNHALTPSAAN